jgi:hypothetical protein
MVAAISLEQLLVSARRSSLHTLKSAIAFAAVAMDIAIAAALQRVKVAAAYRSEAVK